MVHLDIVYRFQLCGLFSTNSLTAKHFHSKTVHFMNPSQEKKSEDQEKKEGYFIDRCKIWGNTVLSIYLYYNIYEVKIQQKQIHELSGKKEQSSNQMNS